MKIDIVVENRYWGYCMVKPRTLLQAQLIAEISDETGDTIERIRRIFKSYETISANNLLEGKKVPLPGGMGYISLGLTTSKSRTIKSELTSSEVTIVPKLRTVTNYSKPWKERIQNDPRANEIIKKLLDKKIKDNNPAD